MAEERALRADAARNRAQILGTARRLLAERGVDVHMDAIAREAGVAVGTLYRHYPTKADMIRAVLLHSVDELVCDLAAAGEGIDAGARPLESLVEALDRGTRRVWADRSLKLAVERYKASLTPEEFDPVFTALERLFDAAQQERTIRQDVAVDDFVLLLRGIPAQDVDDAGRRRWLQLTLRSLATTKGIKRLDSYFDHPPPV